MDEYHKIQTVYKRDPQTKFRTLMKGEYSLPEFEYLQRNSWSFSEKIDGTNIRIIFDGEKITFGGKTDNAQIPAILFGRLAERFYPLTDQFKEYFPDGVCFYGEGYGAKIQKAGSQYCSKQDFVLFDIKIGDWWLFRPNLESIAKDFSLDVVPIIGFGTLDDMVEMAAMGFSSKWGDFKAEGIVARPEVELKTRSGHRIICKIKYKDFKVEMK